MSKGRANPAKDFGKLSPNGLGFRSSFLGAVVAALPLSGCLLLSYNELEPFVARPLHQRVTLMPRINWITRDDATQYCLSVMKLAGITPPVEPPLACSFWSKEDQLCTIVTRKSTTHSFLGHELRHCFEGNFHEDIDLARRPFPTPATVTATAAIPAPETPAGSPSLADQGKEGAVAASLPPAPGTSTTAADAETATDPAQMTADGKAATPTVVAAREAPTPPPAPVIAAKPTVIEPVSDSAEPASAQAGPQPRPAVESPGE